VKDPNREPPDPIMQDGLVTTLGKLAVMSQLVSPEVVAPVAWTCTKAPGGAGVVMTVTARVLA
jgi:hypothetical protein